MKKNPFVLRVYGLYIDPNHDVLVSDEYIYGKYVTKFPGGGLEYGEGTIDCLRREMMEETGNVFEVNEHFYTTDNFVQSAFNPEIQVISIYYKMKPLSKLELKLSDKIFDFDAVEGAQSFRMISLKTIRAEDFTLPIDRHVADLLRNRFDDGSL
ncbi:MAG: NUDIX domain-containing protein [Bacteroidetes bacterium]|nr:NUDIX domain-containing protein [Bacteroidota bacterium]